jgi:hypothetical protein
MSRRAFDNLQQAIINKEQFPLKQLKNALLYRSESPETYAIVRLALISKRIDPNYLFIETSVMSIQYDDLFLRYAALGLRYGADPNTYVKAKFTFRKVIKDNRNQQDENERDDDEEIELEKEEIIEVPIHIAKRLWDITPRNEEESLQADYDLFGYFDFDSELEERITQDVWSFQAPRNQEESRNRYRQKEITLMTLLSMMTIKGFSSDLTISNAGLLTASGINATRFTINNPEFFYSVYADIKLDQSNPRLSDDIIDEIKYFSEWKNSLQSIYGINSDRDYNLLNYAILLDLSEILTLSDIYGIIDNLRNMFIFQDNESLKIIIPRLKDLALITNNQIGDENNSETSPDQKQLELSLFNWGIEYYNQTAITLLLEMGIMPDYSVRSATIRAAKNIYKPYPVLCQIINRCILDYVQYGYGLNSEQMMELAFAPDLQEAINQEYSTPTWVHMCKVGGNIINPDMKEIAREIGIPIGSTKQQICNTFEGLSKSDPVTVKQTLHKVNKNHILVESISASDIISGKASIVEPIEESDLINEDEDVPETVTLRNARGQIISKQGSATANNINPNSQLIPKGAAETGMICSNAAFLEKPIEDVPEIDRVTYNDSNDTWCLLLNDWKDFLRTKQNPWVRNLDGSYGAPIPLQVIDEMERKLNLITSQGLEPELSSIDDAVDQLFEASPARTQKYYDRSSKKRLEDFFLFAESYGVARRDFDFLKRIDYQRLSDELLSPVNKLDVRNGLPTFLLNDFADRLLIEIENFQDPDVVGDKLYSLLSSQ